MCKFFSNKKYDAIIIPLTSFNYLLTDEEQINCLSSIRNHLLDNGFAIIELLSKKTFLDTNSSEDWNYIKKIVASDNSYYDYYRNTILNIDERKISQRRLFKYYVDGKYLSEEELEWKNRFVTVEDFYKLTKEVGLEIEQIYGNCKLEPYNSESEDVFIRVRRK